MGRSLASWWRRLLAPHDARGEASERRLLLRCKQCNSLLWKGGSATGEHVGHRLEVAVGGTWWEFVRMKMGWIK